MNTSDYAALLLAGLSTVTFFAWYARISERAARREWAAFHRWSTGRK